MHAQPTPIVKSEVRSPRRGLVDKLLRYGVGSAVATVCSELTFFVVYGSLGATTTVASLLGWLAGAIPNFWLNRSWTWGRHGWPSVRRELLPYAAIVLATLLLAIGATSATEAALAHVAMSHTAKAVVLSGVFLLAYVVIFFARFLLLDRLFGPLSTDVDADGLDSVTAGRAL